MFSWECHYAIAVDSYKMSAFTPVNDNLITIVKHNHFNIRMRFYHDGKNLVLTLSSAVLRLILT